MGRNTCRNKPYEFKTLRVKKSPFRTMKNAKRALRAFKLGASIGFTATSSLKSMGLIPRSTGCFLLGSKYA
jgi:hypothetical protein